MASFDDVDFDDPVDLGRAQFGTQRKGYDQQEVRRFLQLVARHASERRDALRSLEARVAELEASLAQAQSEMVRELSEDELRELLGAEAAKVLQAAHDAYDEQIAEAETERESARKKLEAEREAVKQRSSEDYLAEIESAKATGRELVIEAQVVRERVLRDLNRRRQSGRRELEQVRAGRDRLLASFASAQDALDHILDEIEVSLPQARIAAEAAGRRFDMELELEQSGDAEADDTAQVEAIEREIAVARDLDLPMVDQSDHPEARTADESSGGDKAEPADESEAGSAAAPAPATVVLRDLGPVKRGLFSKRPKEADELPTMEVPVLRARESFEGVTVVAGDSPSTIDEAAPTGEPTEASHSAQPAAKDRVDESAVDRALDDDVDALFAKLRAKSDPGTAETPEPKVPASKEAAPTAVAPDPDDLDLHERATEVVGGVATATEESDDDSEEPEESDAEAKGSTKKKKKKGKKGKKGAKSKSSRKNGSAADDEDQTRDGAGPETRTDEWWLTNRARLLDGLETQLARQLKRTLADDQNELFDLVRRAKKQPTFDDVPAADEHARWYFAAVEGMLDRIARAGHEFITGTSGPAGQADLAGPEQALVDGLIQPLRDVIEAAFSASDVTDPLADIRFNARTIRDDLVPVAAANASALAFMVGASAAIDPGGDVRWVFDPEACGDECRLRGEQPPRPMGEPFDGRSAPPAMVGCCCLLVPVS